MGSTMNNVKSNENNNVVNDFFQRINQKKKELNWNISIKNRTHQNNLKSHLIDWPSILQGESKLSSPLDKYKSTL